ncbi:hypothetical protein RN001_007036 [Aquatica leii]|uniref:Uncharacterized protein n=1 Tax=Aquatica leii TaxID=1421715 RepID=A0AAN7Q6N0_9COLE|nr:hypothetical protein RN001_007036 [Aquatica leii]
MTLNHSKTWPVNTMAVVQLRVDTKDLIYDFEKPEKNECEDDNDLHENCDENRENENCVVFPLSKNHLELFTKMSAHLHKTVRTDTVSTILEQDEFDSEHQSSTVQHNPNQNSFELSDLLNLENIEKFHVLALHSRLEEDGRISGLRHSSRRASNKVDNWDLIYTETNGNQFSKNCNENNTINVKARAGGVCNKHNECFLPDIPLDARKTTTLRRHYYPEGGWGWVIIVCSVLLNVINHGLQLSCSQFAPTAAEKFSSLPIDVTDP